MIPNRVRFLERCVCTVGAGLVLSVATFAAPALGQSHLKTDILVLGDSQLSFGGGPALKDFLSNLKTRCQSLAGKEPGLNTLEGRNFGMLGTRSTSLQSWVTRGTPAWRQLCRKDKRHGVNASAWGTLKKPKRRYVQVGEGAKYQFCKRSRTPLQALFTKGYYKPRVLMFFIGGNGAGRLAGSRKAAQNDVDRLIKTLPEDVGCVFMLTVPIFTKRRNRTRLRAQRNLKKAFAAHDGRCALVEGFTSKTIASIEGKSRFFRRRRSGAVKDPFHPNETASRRFMALTGAPLCRALINQFGRSAKRS